MRTEPDTSLPDYGAVARAIARFADGRVRRQAVRLRDAAPSGRN